MELHPKILSKNGKPEFVILPFEEFLNVRAALARLTEKEMEDPRYGGFSDNLSAEEFAKRQGVKPVADLSELAWPFGPEDWEGFEEAVDECRHGHRGHP
jgi:hypothetical protein